MNEKFDYFYSDLHLFIFLFVINTGLQIYKFN